MDEKLSTIEEYKQDFENDQSLDQMDLMEKLELLPSITHKWLFRLFTQKGKLLEMEDKKEELRANYLIKIETEDDPRFKGLSEKALNIKIDKSDVIRKINRKIEEKKQILFYLEEVVNITKFILPKSCENIVKLKDLESR